jgi:hypothetical protein
MGTCSAVWSDTSIEKKGTRQVVVEGILRKEKPKNKR